jgi:diguanylate cyclase (GGDEF)-like protein
MSLIRQIWLLLLGSTLLALLGSLAINVVSTRDTLQTQVRLKNDDNAQAMALALSQQKGDTGRMGLLATAQFDTGHYRSIRLLRGDGSLLFERQAKAPVLRAPGWFVELLPIASPPGMAQLTDGWRPLGRVEVVSQVAYAHDDLWRSARHTAWLMALLGAASAGLAWLAIERMRRPLRATVEQAAALAEGRYLTVPEPAAPEFRQLVATMNAMVQRLRAMFENQAGQLDSLRRQAHNDPLTGLPHRAHFMALLGSTLQNEDGLDGGGLVLVRLADLAGLNLLLGRDSTDRALSLIAEVLQAYPQRVTGCFVGRLNGSDFALCLPAAGITGETAHSIAAALQASLATLSSAARVHVGAVELQRGQSETGALMACADVALARAEAQGPFAVELIDETPADARLGGERHWRAQIVQALASGHSRLMAYPVLDRRGALVHLECPLRLQLEPDGVFEPAARWLPLASRSRLTASTDSHALTLALEAIAGDGVARGINVSGSSLLDGSFAPHVRYLLQESPHLARKLWLEIDEKAALAHFDTVQEFGRLLRPLGVRFGLEHAGQRLHLIDRLFELGLDYVKLDASLCRGVAHNDAALGFVKSTVALLHALSLQVQCEGLTEADDVQALWACGVDAVTGPWASAAPQLQG